MVTVNLKNGERIVSVTRKLLVSKSAFLYKSAVVNAKLHHGMSSVYEITILIKSFRSTVVGSFETFFNILLIKKRRFGGTGLQYIIE